MATASVPNGRLALGRLNQPQSAETLIRNIDERVAHIHAQVGLGANLEEVAAEQARALLQTFSQLSRIGLGVVTEVSNHLQTNEVWDGSQLAAFSACLRSNSNNRLHQPGPRAMQSNPCLEYYLLQEDWDKLPTLAAPQIQETIAMRLHSFGMVCLHANSLKRASAIVQACSGKTDTDADDKRLYAHGVRKLLKTLDKDLGPWPFEYIKSYPRSPFELSAQMLDFACGSGVRPVQPPGKFEGTKFHLLVCTTPYKKQRLNQTPRLHHTPAESAIVPAASQALAASSGHCGGPFAAMVALMQAASEQYGLSMVPPGKTFKHRSATLEAEPPV